MSRALRTTCSFSAERRAPRLLEGGAAVVGDHHVVGDSVDDADAPGERAAPDEHVHAIELGSMELRPRGQDAAGLGVVVLHQLPVVECHQVFAAELDPTLEVAENSFAIRISNLPVIVLSNKRGERTWTLRLPLAVSMDRRRRLAGGPARERPRLTLLKAARSCCRSPQRIAARSGASYSPRRWSSSTAC